jgi:2-dehydro-3-deoxyphosphogluconate aldolase/(4S)-4-hydroxy-2-oxoglutarate aldolase
MYLGVGTIKNASTSSSLLLMLVLIILLVPGLVEDAAKVADNNNMLWVPGCMTPTEIIKAEATRSEVCKTVPW